MEITVDQLAEKIKLRLEEMGPQFDSKHAALIALSAIEAYQQAPAFEKLGEKLGLIAKESKDPRMGRIINAASLARQIGLKSKDFTRQVLEFIN